MNINWPEIATLVILERTGKGIRYFEPAKTMADCIAAAETAPNSELAQEAILRVLEAAEQEAGQ